MLGLLQKRVAHAQASLIWLDPACRQDFNTVRRRCCVVLIIRLLCWLARRLDLIDGKIQQALTYNL
jgi:hypothetical protein